MQSDSPVLGIEPATSCVMPKFESKANPSTSNPPDRLNELLLAVAREVTNLRAMRAASPTVSHDASTKILDALDKMPGSSRSDLADALLMSPKDVGNQLQALQHRGEVICLGNRRAARWFPQSLVEKLTAPK